MRLRRRIFLLSVLLHLIVIYWIIRVEIPMLIYPEKEKVIAVVPISALPPNLMSLSSQRVTAGKKLPGKKTALATRSPSRTGSTPTTPADKVVESEIPVEAPKLVAPPPEVKKIPELSIYSENIRDIVRNFNRKRARTGSEGTAAGVGESGTGEGSGPVGQNQAFFNIENYDLSPWAKRVLFTIQKNWLIPMATEKSVEQPVEITIVIEKNGNISSIKVKQSSNSDTFDQAAVNALRLSSPLPNLPQDFPFKNLEARFMFTSILQ
ncbi:MAG: TonB family protein [Candidatus Aminicenantes bacterium]|jgi:TonB family protein